jgi:Skp family chaperone for outer membrane proteins
MKKLIFGAAIAALAMPLAAQAQQLPQAVIMVVDTDRVIRECTVCVAANTQLQQQIQQLQARAQQLGTPLRTEGQSIQTAVNAVPAGQQPDAALQARIRAYETQQQTAQQEIQTRQQTIQRNREFVLQQIGDRIRPAVTQVMAQRGASVVVDAGSILSSSPALDVTAAILAAVNQNTAALNVNAPPPQQPAAATPAATTPATTPQRPRPTGR